MTHTCHVPNCNAPVPSRLLMCAAHWAKVPAVLKEAVWANYRPGQEKDKSVSRAWVMAARAAIKSVTVKA